MVRIKKLLSRGDTIVEVLIAITVISLILGGAYASANSSLNNTRRAQERGEALKVSESQLEVINNLYTSNNSNLISNYGFIFCVDSSGQPQNATNTPIPMPANGNLPANITDYSSQCTSQSSVPYHTLITRVAADPSDPKAGFLYTTYIKWDKVGGGSVDQMNLKYRLGGVGTPTSTTPPVTDTGGSDPNANPDNTAYCNQPGVDCTPKGNIPPRWHYNDPRVNTTVLPPGVTVVSCSWSWGDGTTDVNRACNPGDPINHNYPNENLVPSDYPSHQCLDSRTIYANKIVQTVTFSNGVTSSKIASPACVPNWGPY